MKHSKKKRKKKNKTAKPKAHPAENTINPELFAQAKEISATKDIEAALAYLGEHASPVNIPDYLTALAQHLKSTEPDKAFKAASKAVSMAPESATGGALLCGQLQYRQGQHNEAAAYFLHVVKANTSTPEQILIAANSLVRLRHQDIKLIRWGQARLDIYLAACYLSLNLTRNR